MSSEFYLGGLASRDLEQLRRAWDDADRTGEVDGFSQGQVALEIAQRVSSLANNLPVRRTLGPKKGRRATRFHPIDGSSGMLDANCAGQRYARSKQ